MYFYGTKSNLKLKKNIRPQHLFTHHLTHHTAMEIIDIINRIHPLPPDSLNAILSAVSEVEYPKHFHLFRENHCGTKSYFIRRGLVRAYAYKDDKEITFWFGKEGNIIFPMPSLFAGTAEYANVELLEDSAFYEIDLKRLQELYLSDIHLANWGRKYAEYTCIQSDKLFISRQFKTALENYRELLRDYPRITQRVPLGIIASYLGITQVSLSRIRAQIK